MGLFTMLSKFKFYVIDKRSKPEPEVFEFDSRGQAVTFGYSRSGSCRHSRKRDNCYVIPAAPGKKKR